MSMREAVARFVPDGASICMGAALEALIPFAAGHELIRQRRRDLTLIGPISDILFDQLIGAGCVRRVIAAWVGNVSAGLGYNYRRAVEQRIPAPLEVQGADEEGHAHVWGTLGVTRPAALAARQVILVAEEIRPRERILSDPGLVLTPALKVAAVVHQPFGAFPSPVQGHYRRHHDFYHRFHDESRTVEGFQRWLAHWVHEVPDWTGFLSRLDAGVLEDRKSTRLNSSH